MKPDVSIIMPVYNSEDYLLQAADSVLNQSYRNIELILVDDGSTDSSGEICDRLAVVDKRVRVLHKENGGICSARNAGLRMAWGDYIGFCDNDDEYLPGLVEDNYRYAMQYHADIVRYGRKRICTRDGKVIEETVSEIDSFRHISAEEFVKNYAYLCMTMSGVWTGLYKRSFLKEGKIIFNENFRNGIEDALFNVECYQNHPDVVINPKIYYRWKQRLEHSTTGKFHEALVDNLIFCMQKEWDFVKENQINKSTPGLWQDILISRYYSEILNRISTDICDSRGWEKRKMLLKLRRGAGISYQSDFSDLRYLKKKGVLHVFRWLLIKYRFVYLLYLLVALKKKVSAKHLLRGGMIEECKNV